MQTLLRVTLAMTSWWSAACVGTIVDYPEPSDEPRPCSTNGECPDGVCLFYGDDSTCSQICADEQECAGGWSCTLAHDAEGMLRQGCLPAPTDGRAPGAICEAPDDCRTRICHESLCLETCTACADEQACAPMTLDFAGELVDVPVCRWSNPWRRVELGATATPLGGSAEITFNVPPRSASFTIVLIDDDGLRVTVNTLVAPDNTVLLNLADGAPDINPAFSYPGAAALFVPSTDALGAAVQTGSYRMRVGTYDPTNWEALVQLEGDIERIFLVTEQEGEQGGLVDLNLHLAPGTGVTAASAAADPFVVGLLAKVEEILGRLVDVRFADLRFFAIPATHDVVEEGQEIRDILAEYSQPGPHGASINVFLVADISFTSGYSAGIPGPPSLYGSVASGLIVERLATAEATGIILAHEMGHFFGLRHTTELTGGHDSISDTPECPGGTAVVDCPDYANLMFPLVALDREHVLSPGQRAVVRRHPLLYEVSRANACPTAGVVYDMTDDGFATGDTAKLTRASFGSCGGEAAPERWQLFRVVDAAAVTLHVRAVGLDFAPAVYVRQGDCTASAIELACEADDTASEVLLDLEAVNAGAYFIAVDGRDVDGGSFVLEVWTTD